MVNVGFVFWLLGLKDLYLNLFSVTLRAENLKMEVEILK